MNSNVDKPEKDGLLWRVCNEPSMVAIDAALQAFLMVAAAVFVWKMLFSK